MCHPKRIHFFPSFQVFPQFPHRPRPQDRRVRSLPQLGHTPTVADGLPVGLPLVSRAQAVQRHTCWPDVVNPRFTILSLLQCGQFIFLPKIDSATRAIALQLRQRSAWRLARPSGLYNL